MSRMSLFTLVAVLLTAAGGPAPQRARILIGTPPVPVVSGDVWLIANRWGAYPGVLVATIRNGEIHSREGIEDPPYWDQAFDYKVLVAISDQPRPPASSQSEDYAYGMAGQRAAYLAGFPDIYLSSPLARKGLGKNWQEALRELGHASGDALALPSPARRTLRLEYPDGKAFVGAQVDVMLFGSNENHCDVPVGIEMGNFKTNSNGEISFIATNSALAIDNGYYEQTAGGPAGTTFTLQPYALVDSGQDITVKRLWKLPEYEYVLSLHTTDNHAMAHARLTACDNTEACGTGCGPLRAGESDERGALRFRHADLREERSITVVNASGQSRELTSGEMRQLLTTHELRVTW